MSHPISPDLLEAVQKLSLVDKTWLVKTLQWPIVNLGPSRTHLLFHLQMLRKLVSFQSIISLRNKYTHADTDAPKEHDLLADIRQVRQAWEQELDKFF